MTTLAASPTGTGRRVAILSVLLLPLIIVAVVLLISGGWFVTEPGNTATENAASFQEGAAGSVLPWIALGYTSLVLVLVAVCIVAQCVQVRGVPVRRWTSYAGIGLVGVALVTEALHSAVIAAQLFAEPTSLPGFADALGSTDASFALNTVTGVAFTFAVACAAFTQAAAHPKAGTVIGTIAIVLGLASVVLPIPLGYVLLLFALGVVQLRAHQ